ncbi:MAG: ATP synthase F1 subunit gamma [Lachnospiraceae bacterium]|nr:ATP synthase F1 subunit gamma [Lachnospiraceae bacterium]
MFGAQELKDRMRGIEDTQKITNAMYLIASMKMRKAKEALDHTRPFFDAVSSEIKRIFRTTENVRSRYFYPPEGEQPLDGTYGMLVVSADKGLAGAYNQNVLKRAEEMLKTHPDFKLYVVGEYGRQYFLRRGIEIEQNFLYTAQNPTMDRAREISAALLDAYDEGRVQKIYILYTDFRGGLSSDPNLTRILPFHRSTFISPTPEKKVLQPFEFIPSVEEVLEELIPNYVGGFIYSALVDSFCAEQNARMSAMSAANDHAEGRLAELKGTYQKLRQEAITQEITELMGGRAHGVS